MSKYYKEAIEYITQDKDWFAIAKHFAANYPAAFVIACQSIGWEREAKILMEAGKKIDAIKLCRQYTGMSVRDAKDCVERMA